MLASYIIVYTLNLLYSKQQPQCEICKDNLKLKNVIYLPCGENHILCRSCYKDSIEKRGPRCPCCNDPISRTGNFEIPDDKKYDISSDTFHYFA